MIPIFISGDLLMGLAAVLTCAFVALLWWLNWSQDNPFHIHDLLIAPETGKASVAHVTLIGAFVCSSMVLVWEAISGRMSEWLLTAYLGTWGAVKVGELVTRVRAGAAPGGPK